MNRFFRRMQQFGKRSAPEHSQGQMASTEQELHSAEQTQDVEARRKNSRHKKMTADKWNQ